MKTLEFKIKDIGAVEGNGNLLDALSNLSANEQAALQIKIREAKQGLQKNTTETPPIKIAEEQKTPEPQTGPIDTVVLLEQLATEYNQKLAQLDAEFDPEITAIEQEYERLLEIETSRTISVEEDEPMSSATKDLIELLGKDTVNSSVNAMAGVFDKETEVEKERHEELMKNETYKYFYDMGDQSRASSPMYKQYRDDNFISYLEFEIETDEKELESHPERKDYLENRIKDYREAIEYINQTNAKYDSGLAEPETQQHDKVESTNPIDQKIIDSLTEEDYIEINKRVLTESGKEHARGENKQETIFKTKQMAQLSFDYLDGKISASEYLRTPPYRYTDQNTQANLEKYAETESAYFKNLREKARGNS